MIRRVGEWFPVHFCVNCDEELDRAQVMYSYGMCPHCAAMRGRSTIVATYTRAAMWVPKTKPWWAFWRQDYERVFKADSLNRAPAPISVRRLRIRR